MLDKEISQIFDSITNQWDRNTIQINIKEILLTKRKRVSDEEAYFNSLCENIAYLTESSYPIKKILESCFQKNMFWDTTNAESCIMDSQNSIREEMPTLSSIYKKKLRKNSLSESVSEAEFSYAYSKLRNDIEIDFLFAFLHTNNRSFMTPFLNSEPTQFFTTIDRLSDFYTNLLLQNIGFTVPNNKEASKEVAATQVAVTRKAATQAAAARKETAREAAARELAARKAAAAIRTKKKGFFARLFGM
jgi:hypothetical protein